MENDILKHLFSDIPSAIVCKSTCYIAIRSPLLLPNGKPLIIALIDTKFIIVKECWNNASNDHGYYKRARRIHEVLLKCLLSKFWIQDFQCSLAGVWWFENEHIWLLPGSIIGAFLGFLQSFSSQAWFCGGLGSCEKFSLKQ